MRLDLESMSQAFCFGSRSGTLGMAKDTFFQWPKIVSEAIFPRTREEKVGSAFERVIC